MAADERELIRAKLVELFKKVPQKVNSGSIETTRNFKRWYAKSIKIAEAPRSSQSQVMSVYTEAIEWYR